MKHVVLDQGLPASAVSLLVENGWDAVHVRDLGMKEADDSEILEYAVSESRVVITLDSDFPQILALTSATKPSVVFIRQQRLRAQELMRIMTEVWREYEAALARGSIISVGVRRTRTRILPLR